MAGPARECGAIVAAAASALGGPLPGPLPIFPGDNWWNLDISTAPVDPASASYVTFIGPTRTMHPDFGGDISPGSAQGYGFPYAVVDSTVPLRNLLAGRWVATPSSPVGTGLSLSAGVAVEF
jgi:hypothetical protein